LYLPLISPNTSSDERPDAVPSRTIWSRRWISVSCPGLSSKSSGASKLRMMSCARLARSLTDRAMTSFRTCCIVFMPQYYCFLCGIVNPPGRAPRTQLNCSGTTSVQFLSLFSQCLRGKSSVRSLTLWPVGCTTAENRGRSCQMNIRFSRQPLSGATSHISTDEMSCLHNDIGLGQDDNENTKTRSRR
jgi:hypothetical protein